MTPAQSLCVYCRERPVESKWQPFCSERCRLLDLSRWLDGDYRVAGDSVDDTTGPTDDADSSTPNSRYARHNHDHR
jgi:endogenous inhibitor of DNA gyrase (YacG/DUF329 family)